MSFMRLPHLLAVAALLIPSAHAADAVTDAMQAAYAPYREALFRTNSKAQAESEKAMAQAQVAWKGLAARFAAGAPAPYDRDAAFAATLSKVAAVYDKAEAEIASGKLPQAHETLEEARDLMAELRRRNGVIVFSDHMNAYHAEMEHLLTDGPRLLAGPQGVPRLTAQAGVLQYLARQLREQAPAALRQDAEFERLLKEVEASVQSLLAAALSQDPAAIRDAMSKVKPPYSRLFLKFG